MPGCILWIDAADTSRFTLNGSNVLTAIQDKSVLNNTMTTTTTGASSAGYVWNATNFNSSYPAFFTNSGLQNCNIGATSSLSAYATPMTMFVVGRYDGISSSGNGYLFDSTARISMNGPNTANAVTNGLSTGTATGTTITETFPSGNFINSVVMNGASSVLYTNGTSSATGTLTNAVTFGAAVAVGSQYTNNSAWYGAICEVLFFNYALGTTELQQVEGYLAWKWGLQASLAAGHPYKNNVTVVKPFLRQFRPVDVSTPCLLWFDGADASTVTGTSTVTAWNDKSGNANHINSFSATAPSYNSSTGLLTFSGGTGATSSVVNVTSASAWTAFFAVVLSSGYTDTGTLQYFRPLSHTSPTWFASISRGSYNTTVTGASISGSNTVYTMASTAQFTAGNTVTISGITLGSATGYNGTGTVQSVVTNVSVTVNITSTGTPTSYTGAIMFRSGGASVVSFNSETNSGSGPFANLGSSLTYNSLGGDTFILAMSQISATPSYVLTVNGTFPSVSSPNAASTFTSGKNLTVGTISGGLSHQIGEILFYDGTLSTQDRQRVEGYLIWKWGAQRTSYPGASTNITSAHPYYSFPSAATTPFDLRIFGGVDLWLDAADSTTVSFSSGSTVSVWSDKSGNGRNATAVSTDMTYVTAGLNALNTIRGNQTAGTTSSGFTTPSFAISTTNSVSVFVVYNQLVVPTSAVNVDSTFITMPTSTNLNVFTRTTNGNTTTSFFSRVNGVTSGSYSIAIPYASIFDFVYSPETGTNYVNGSSVVTLTTTTGGTAALNSSFILTLFSGAMQGDICELVIYKSALTKTQRLQTEGYLAWKWGLQTSLPTTHPYRKVMP